VALSYPEDMPAVAILFLEDTLLLALEPSFQEVVPVEVLSLVEVPAVDSFLEEVPVVDSFLEDIQVEADSFLEETQVEADSFLVETQVDTQLVEASEALGSLE